MPEYINKIRTASGDLQINYSALANLPSLNNNLLINSVFRNPVNQRGKSTYTYTDADTQYTVDRWRSTGCNVAIGGSSLTIKNRSGLSTSMFCQPFEHALGADTYCVTVGCQNLVGNVYVALNANGTNKKKLSSGVNTFSFTTSDQINGFYILFDGASTEDGMSLYYAKLEIGSVATPIVPRQYAEELAICKRYYQVYNGHKSMILTQTVTSSTETNGRFNMSVDMRCAPNVTIESLYFKEVANGTEITPTQIVGEGIADDTIQVTITHASRTVSQRYMYAKGYLDAEIY